MVCTLRRVLQLIVCGIIFLDLLRDSISFLDFSKLKEDDKTRLISTLQQYYGLKHSNVSTWTNVFLLHIFLFIYLSLTRIYLTGFSQLNVINLACVLVLLILNFLWLEGAKVNLQKSVQLRDTLMYGKRVTIVHIFQAACCVGYMLTC
eukprot:TRINITY_DN7373_c0_g1_i4.p1 TRINITY_DN7373_c0_g1~~TRINITY_DN7373_c0_g1_i4.p1  ORF type:complete len:148 (-),score=8.59 TRINITY_DN7373_c0_g1_i4:45-488(-)